MPLERHSRTNPLPCTRFASELVNTAVPTSRVAPRLAYTGPPNAAVALSPSAFGYTGTGDATARTFTRVESRFVQRFPILPPPSPANRLEAGLIRLTRYTRFVALSFRPRVDADDRSRVERS